MQHKFKVGDVVRCVRTEGCNLERNTSYTVVDVGQKFVYLKGPGISNSTKNGYMPSRLALWSDPIHKFWDGVVRHKKDEETHSSSGGPYVCVSVYNELKKQNAELEAELEHVKQNYVKRFDELTDLQTQNAYLNSTIDTELLKIKDRLDLIEGLSWKKPKQHSPTHPPEQLFPADLAPGTYVAMDKDGDWYSFVEEPKINERLGLWVPKNGGGPSVCNCLADKTPYMKAYNRQSWTSSLHIIGKK